MPEQLKCSLPSGSIVYMTGVVDLKEIYIRKLEDHDDDHEKFLDMVNEFCLSAVPINRPLVIGEIVGAQSTIDNNFYRGKVLKKIDDVTYSLQFIDFGDKDNVPSSKIFEIPEHFMTPSNVIKITLKGVNDIPLNVDALNYVSNLLSTCEPMIIEFSSVRPLKDVSLTTVNSNENVNKRINELLNNDDCTSTTDVKNQLEQVNVNIEENTASNRTVPGLKKGDSVYITTFINVHNCFVRKVEDDTDELYNFIENVNLYCSAETPIGKLPKLNDLIGAKSIDGSFYRGKVMKKVNDNSYDVHFIDFGMDENVSLSDIVNLSTELKQVIPTTILVKLKNVSSSILNEAAREYVTLISEKALIIDMIEDNTNEVILKTEENESVNDRLKELMFENIKEININDLIEIDEEFKSVECNVTTLKPGSVVYLTAFVNMDEMYIRKLEDYNDEFHNLLDKVNEFCLSAKPINRPLIIGQIVGAQSTLDDSFYRGKVLKKIDDFNYSIQFIDFGDKDNVPLSKTFEIPADFMVPSTIMEINLKGIKSHSLSIEASNYITNLLTTYEPLSIDFDNQFPIKDVTLVVIKNNENVAESLNKLLKDENSTTTIKIVEDEHVKEDELMELPDIPKSSEVREPKLCDETNILKNGDIVFITSYIDLYNIFVRKLEDNNVEFQNLIESVNTYCISENTSKSKSPELNEIVGAKSSVDGYFYRAKIVEKTDENTYETIFIDYGFEESVNIADTVPLPIHLQQVTPTITLVGLKGASFENLNSESHNYLENLMLLSEPMKIEFEDLTKVKLTVISQKQNIIDHLNELNVDNTTVDNTIINNSLQLTSGMKYISNDITVPPIPPLTNKCIITIHAFISLKDIYISVPFNKAEVDKFLKDFSVYCLTLQPITRNPVVGEVFGIRSSTNNSFNRGVVEEKLNENQYKVVLFDLGTKDIVSANSFVEIPDHLQQVPRTIYSIRLKDIDSGILNTQAMSYVNMLCENLPLIIEFDEKSPNGLNAVTLTTIKTQQNVNNHLIKLLTQKERDSPETVQMLSKGDIVYISTFVDLHAIYVRRINNGTDKFKSFLENFSSSCALESPIKNDPNVGAIIAAREQGGNKFYRAEVISRVDNDNFNVCFIDFGYCDTVHKNNMVQPSESQLQNCPPTFMVGLHGLDAEPANATILHYMEDISQTDTFIIDSITELNKVVLISANTQCNINKEIKTILGNGNIGQHIKNGVNANGDKDTEKCVIKYHKPPLDVATQVWVADKISPSKYSVHTSDSRLEFIQLENQIFEDSKTFESVKSVSVNMPCIVYFSPSWYRGVVLEVIDKVTAKVGLVDVGNFSVVRSIKEIFRMPSKYKGKSLLVNIEIQPEPQEKLAVTSFKIVAKKHLDNVTVVEVLLGSTVDQSYDDLDNVGLPSFSSTPIPEDSTQFQFNNSRNEQNLLSTTLCQEQQTSGAADHSKRFSNMLTIKDVQYARWLKGAVKTLTFLCVNGDCLMMRDHLIDDTLADLEAKIQEHCVIAADPLYTPAENELCLAKYFDELWYRAICVKTPNDLVKNNNDYMVYFLDWGMEYLTKVEDIKKMPKDFIYLPATAHKCYVKDIPVLEWSADTMHAVSELGLKQLPSTIDDKLSNDSYMISCAAIKDLFDKNLQ